MFKRVYRSIMLLVLICGLSNQLSANPVQADPSGCSSSVNNTDGYTLTICFTDPIDGAVLSEDKPVSVTVTYVGAHPPLSSIDFFLNGNYVLEVVSQPYTFTLPSTFYVDGNYTLSAEVEMSTNGVYKNPFIQPLSERPSINISINNGITSIPPSTRQFTPTLGTTPDAGKPFVLAAVGDGAGGDPHRTPVSDMIYSWNPNLFLYLGDVNQKGSRVEFNDWYGTSRDYGQLRSITNPTPGNHDYLTSGADGYFDYWGNQGNPANNVHYYSYTIGNWHLISLDSNENYNHLAANSDQILWLASDLQANQDKCLLVYYHHPAVSDGPQKNNITRLVNIWNLLYQYRVDIVLNGHDHGYQHFTPLDANLQPATDGITEFVTGTGGQGHQAMIRYDQGLLASADTYGAMRFELYNGFTNFEFIETTGKIIDSGPIQCHHSGPPYDISGTVTLPGGGGLAGVTVAINGQTAVTDADGKYTIYSLPDGTAGDLTPSKDGYTFSPDKISISNITGNLTEQDFTAALNSYAISGKVTSGSGGLAGVTVALGAYSATTDDDGTYTIASVPYGTTAALIPALAGYGFSPGSLPVNNLSGPLTGKDFIATLNTYPISGKVTLAGGGNLKGVKVALGPYSANTADDGTYLLSNVPYGTAGDLTPSLAGYNFTPGSRPIDNLTGPLTGLDFTAALNTYTISGKVTSSSGSLAGVTVSLNSYSAVTGADGKYIITSVPYGTAGDLTPSKTGYNFSLNKITIASLTGNLANKDFTATLNTYTISGKVTAGGSGLKGVTVAVGSYHATTTDDGTYSISNVPYGTTDDLTPSLAGYGFSPNSRPVNNLSGALTAQDFAAALNTYAISGKVSTGSGGLVGVTVALNGYSALTDVDGKYTLSSMPYGTAGDLTPSKDGYTFNPKKITITSLTGTLTNQDFAATLNNYTVSGTITLTGGGALAGVTVALNGYSAVTDKDGKYILSSVPHGTAGDLTPSKAGYTFDQEKITITSLTGPLTGQDFTATLNTYTISGKVISGSGGLAGVIVALGSYNATTASDGTYTILQVPYGTSGKLTPTLAGYAFDPPNKDVQPLQSALPDQNFTALRVYKVSGFVTSGKPALGFGGVTVSLGSYNTTTASDGSYTIISIPAGTKGSLTASRSGYTFYPTSISIPALAADLSIKNFTAAQMKLTVSGKVTVNGKAVRAVVIQTSINGTPYPLGLKIPDVTTDSNGNYAIRNLPGGNNYYITPALAGYTFDPDGAKFDALKINQTQSFKASLHSVTISGKVTGLAAGVSAQIRYGTGLTQVVPTASNGTYTIVGLPANVSYTLTPQSTAASNYRFAPAFYKVNAGAGMATLDAVTVPDFVAKEQSVLSGTVTVQGKPVRGVTITMAGFDGFSAVTDSRGKYSLWVPKQTAMTPKASHPYFKFADGKDIESDNDADALNQDWTTAAVLVNGKISGLAPGDMGNVVISASPAVKGSPQVFVKTDPSTAKYTLTVNPADTPNLAAFTVTPTLEGYTFSPRSLPVNMAGGIVKSFDFKAIPNKWSVSGKALTLGLKSLGGVEIDATINAVLHKLFTNSQGSFTLGGVPYHAEVNLSAKKYGYSITTANVYPFTMGNKNVSGLVFTAGVVTLDKSITGTIRLTDLTGKSTVLRNVLVSLKYKGDTVFSTRTNAAGNYIFSYLYAGTTAKDYEVMPILTNYDFNPASLFVDLRTNPQSGQDFSASWAAPLKGRITGLPTGTQSIDFSITGLKTDKRTVPVDRYGNYNINNLDASLTPYTVTPVLPGYQFTPATFSVSMTTKVVIKNFKASLNP